MRAPHITCGGLSSRILLQLFRSRPLSDGTRGVSHPFRDQHDLAHPWRSCSDTRRDRSVHTPPSRRLPSQQVRPSRYGGQGRYSRHTITRSRPTRPPVHAGGWTPAPAPRRHARVASAAACQGLDRTRRARAALPSPVSTKLRHAVFLYVPFHQRYGDRHLKSRKRRTDRSLRMFDAAYRDEKVLY